jgi:hypothetical protein
VEGLEKDMNGYLMGEDDVLTSRRSKRRVTTMAIGVASMKCARGTSSTIV